MEEDNTRQLLTFLAIAAVVIGGYFLLEWRWGSPPADEPEKAGASVSGAKTKAERASAKPAAASGGEQERPKPAPALELALPERRAEIESDSYVATVSSIDGGLVSLKLKGARYRTNGSAMDLVTTDKPRYLSLAFEIDGLESGKRRWQIERLSPQAVRLRWQGDGLRVVRKLETGAGPYQLWVTTRVHNASADPRSVRLRIATHHYVEASAEEGGFLAVRSPAVSNGLCHTEGATERLDKEDLAQPQRFKQDIKFAAVENVYFLGAVVPVDPAAQDCTLRASERGGALGSPEGTLFSSRLRYPELELEPGQETQYRALAYFGPKTPRDLERAGHALPEAIDLGFFAQISSSMTALLRRIHDYVGNWGLAIILLTFLVKVVLYPLTEKSFRSMARQRELKPELDRINKLYADDREKKGAAVMELYRKNGINPMGGCLPQLLQLPVWWALYTSLSSNVELFRAPFVLWWTDLSSPDPFFVLPVALGLLMFVQQKMTPTTMDPVQAKVMMYMMPIMITSFMLFLPEGLCLYMFTNSALSIGQQQFIERRLKRASQGKQGAVVSPLEPAAATAGAKGAEAPSSSPSVTRLRSKPSKPQRSNRRSRRGRK